MTFGLTYAFSERFVLPLSHDEVVHGKGSLVGRIPGGDGDRLATLRAYLAFMWTHPGKKLLFMGGEIAQEREWNHDGEINWYLLEQASHAGIQRLVADLNNLYREQLPLHQRDCEADGFQWVVGDDSNNSVFAYLRRDGGGRTILCVVNMTPGCRGGYAVGVPVPGEWREILNTDAGIYGGANRGNQGTCTTQAIEAHGSPYSLILHLPPLTTLLFAPKDL
jgi:1,4-alpha-glucan branching enzyme